MKNFSIICFVAMTIVLGGSLSSYSQFLEPNRSVFDEHEINFQHQLKLRERFKIDSDSFYKIRMVVLPRFEPEYLFEIRKTDTSYIAVYKKAKTSIARAKNAYKKVVVEIFYSEVSIDDAKDLILLLDEDVSKVNFPTFEIIGTDGTQHYLSTGTGKGGEGWSSVIPFFKSLIKQIEFASGKMISLNEEERSKLKTLTAESRYRPDIKDYENLYKINKYLLEIKDSFTNTLTPEEKERFDEHSLWLEKDLTKLLMFEKFNKEKVTSLIKDVNSWYGVSLEILLSYEEMTNTKPSKMEQRTERLKEHNPFVDLLKKVEEEM